MRSLLLAAALCLAHGHALSAEHVVKMTGGEYAPKQLRAKVGDAIRFVNDDGANHAVIIVTKDHAVNLGMQKPKAETRLQLRQAGRFEVECMNHGHMRVLVTVTE
jgi:plastocyanin